MEPWAGGSLVPGRTAPGAKSPPPGTGAILSGRMNAYTSPLTAREARTSPWPR